MAGGESTNTLWELVSLWALLKFFIHYAVTRIKVYEKSKLIIDWITGKSHINNLVLLEWGKRTLDYKNSFERIYFQHIYRELNHITYVLSKK